MGALNRGDGIERGQCIGRAGGKRVCRGMSLGIIHRMAGACSSSGIVACERKIVQRRDWLAAPLLGRAGTRAPWLVWRGVVSSISRRGWLGVVRWSGIVGRVEESEKKMI